MKYKILVFPEGDSNYTAICLNLPGVVGVGNSPDSSISDIKSAIGAVLETYSDEGKPVPFIEEETYFVYQEIEI